jgi:DNA-binding NarL/FixJ family response regulator
MEEMSIKNDVMSIAVIDDHDVVLEGLCGFLLKKGYPHVEAFHSANELLRRIPQQQYDIYIVDIELPDMNGGDFIDRIRAIHPAARIIVNTMHEEIWIVNTIQEKKVNGVLYKSTDLSQMLEAIKAVSRGEQYFCQKFKRFATENNTKMEHPTKRENEVLQEIAKGKSTLEIASALYISENTVETHRQSLFKKLEAHNVAELMVKAIARGYIDPHYAT